MAISLRHIALIVLLVGFTTPSCKSTEESAPAENNEAGEHDKDAGNTVGPDQQSDVVAAPEPVRAPPRPVGSWPDGYKDLLVDGPFAVGFAHPDDIASELDAAMAVLRDREPVLAAQVDQALEANLGDLKSLLKPELWPSVGLDAERWVAVQLGTGTGTGFDAAVAVAEDTLDASPGDVDRHLNSGQETLRRAGIGLRFVLPLANRAAFEAFLDEVSTTLRAQDAPLIDGYDLVWRVANRSMLGIRFTEDFVVFDTAMFPWGPPRASRDELEMTEALLRHLAGKGFEQSGVGLPAPRESDTRAFFSVEIETLAAIDRIALVVGAIARRGEKEDRIHTATVARELLDRGPFRAYAVEIGSAGAVTSTYFKHAQPELFDKLADQPTLEVPDSLAMFSFAPIIAGLRGQWKEAGLLPAETVDVGDVIRVMTVRNGVLPFLAPTWLTVAPALVWRDLVPAPARWIEPATVERVHVVIDKSYTKDNAAIAVVVIDRGGDMEKHRHGLACITQRRPVQARCRDERIALETVSAATIAKREIHYLLQQRGEDVVMIVSPSEALVTTLQTAPISTSDAITELTFDVRAMAETDLAEFAGTPLEVAAGFMGSVQTNVGIDVDGLHWQLVFEPTVSLAQLATVIGPALVEYTRTSIEAEAVLNLESLAIAAVSHHTEAGSYPIAATAVCSAGAQPNGALVQPGATAWDQPPWSVLRFAVVHAHIYRYCYQSSADGDAFAAWGEASLGTDGTADSRFCISSDRNEAGQAAVAEARRLTGAAEQCSWQ